MQSQLPVLLPTGYNYSCNLNLLYSHNVTDPISEVL